MSHATEDIFEDQTRLPVINIQPYMDAVQRGFTILYARASTGPRAEPPGTPLQSP